MAHVDVGGRKRKNFDELGAEHASASRWDTVSPASSAIAFGVEESTKKAGWTEQEDATVHAAVRVLGTQWAAVADQLPGRTADAVRNRWHRLQKRGIGGSPSEDSLSCLALASSTPGVASAAESPPSVSGEGSRGSATSIVVSGADHGRARWSAEEDAAIEHGVRTFGCRWRQIAQTLPGRSDSSIRNRWHRLRGQSGDDAIGAEEAPHTCAAPHRSRGALSLESGEGGMLWPGEVGAAGGARSDDTTEPSAAPPAIRSAAPDAYSHVQPVATAPDEALALALVAFASQQRPGGVPAGAPMGSTDAAAYSEEGAP